MEDKKKPSVAQERKISIYPKPQVMAKIERYMQDKNVAHKTEVVYEALNNFFNNKKAT